MITISGRALALISLSLFGRCLATSPLGLIWSPSTYGPGGPWNAIRLSVGTPPQTIDLLPGGTWESPVLSSEICRGRSPGLSGCLADPTKLYDSSRSSTEVELSVTHVVVNSTLGPGPLAHITGSAKWVFDTATFSFTDALTRTVPNFDMFVISEGHTTLPNGTEYPLEIGHLSMGSDDPYQSWQNGSGRFYGNMLASHFWNSGATASYSYGLHIGSPTVGLSGSLYIGGYDQSRVVGTVTYQPVGQSWLPIDLLDIGIGVAIGESPFNFTSKTNLLIQEGGSPNRPLSVTVEPRNPHLHLPKPTCDAIASLLPVVFSPDLGLYIWDINSPLYNRITTSPAVLSFTFRLSQSLTSNITISVPFPLLALTLKPPLAPSAAGLKYFPCAPLPANGPPLYGAPTAILGRAFLQAAFIGVNWSVKSTATWFMAQAPGPNTEGAARPEEIAPERTNILRSQNEWVKTWEGSWSVLGGNGVTAATGDSSIPRASNPATLSVAAKIGIGIGAGLSVVVAFACVILWRKRQVMRRTQTKESMEGAASVEPAAPMELGTDRCRELDSEARLWELGGDRPQNRALELG